MLKLKKRGDTGESGFETTSAVEDMIESSTIWFGGFKKIKIIHHSDEWRQDAKIMKQKVSLRIDLIIELLVDLEKIITESAQDDMNSAVSFGDSQTRILWFIAILGIIFTATMCIKHNLILHTEILV